jgi:hypothetical protein
MNKQFNLYKYDTSEGWKEKCSIRYFYKQTSCKYDSSFTICKLYYNV